MLIPPVEIGPLPGSPQHQTLLRAITNHYAITHGGVRPFYFFQTNAPSELQAILGATLPQHSLASAQAALSAMLDLAEHHLAMLANGMITISDVQRELIGRIRSRQADLQISSAI